MKKLISELYIQTHGGSRAENEHYLHPLNITLSGA